MADRPLVERLREEAKAREPWEVFGPGTVATSDLLREAADRLDALEAAVRQAVKDQDNHPDGPFLSEEFWTLHGPALGVSDGD